MKTSLLSILRRHRRAISARVLMLNSSGSRRLRLVSWESWRGEILFHYTDTFHRFTFTA